MMKPPYQFILPIYSIILQLTFGKPLFGAKLACSRGGAAEKPRKARFGSQVNRSPQASLMQGTAVTIETQSPCFRIHLLDNTTGTDPRHMVYGTGPLPWAAKNAHFTASTCQKPFSPFAWRHDDGGRRSSCDWLVQLRGPSDTF